MEFKDRVTAWEDYIEREVDRITSEFENKFRPIIQAELQKLANETGFEIELTSGMGTVAAYANDYENNIQYDVDVINRFIGEHYKPNAISVSIDRLDKDKPWTDPAPSDPDAEDVELQDEAYFNLIKKAEETFAVFADIIELMGQAQQTDGMCGMDFYAKPQLDKVA